MPIPVIRYEIDTFNTSANSTNLIKFILVFPLSTLLRYATETSIFSDNCSCVKSSFFLAFF